MHVIDQIKQKAKAKKGRIVLPEGTEDRMIQAAKKIRAENLAEVTLLGDEDQIRNLAGSYDLDLDSVKVIAPANSPSTASTA